MICDDMALVQEYAQDNSEQAFATLVSRHINLVYSVALRQVRDPHLAEEVAQAVFILLARKGKSLSPKTILSGWLCRTARYVSANTLSIQRRRQFREQEAHMESILNEPEPGAWNQIAPLLDEALNCLGEKEHDAVVLRFFDGKELKQVGAAMGTTEDAARMRVNRGVEKLRVFFTKKGVTLSATTITGAVAANSVQAAPAGLAAAITAAALSGTTITTAAVIAATKAIAMTTLQKTVITAVFAAAVGTGIYEARQATNIRAELQALQQQKAPLTEQTEQLQRERDDATNRLGTLTDEIERLNRNTAELLKFRREASLARESVARTEPQQLVNPVQLQTQSASVSNLQPGRIAEVLAYPENLQRLAATNFARAMENLAKAKSEPERYFFLSEAAKLAFVFGKTEDARGYAGEVLALDQKFLAEPWRSGDAAFCGNLVLGRIAVQEGHLEEAKQYLLQSGKTIGSPVLGSFGPNMTLARDLLKSGEQDAVLQFLELCKPFWGVGNEKLTQWAQDVRSGQMPDFGASIYY
jgi:RNA polymerase sigma factor (sigma-70 family)